MTTADSKAISGWTPDIDAYEPSLASAARLAARFIADMERGAQPYWITLTGKQGCGKTMLARQLYQQSKLTNPGRGSLWVSGNGVYDSRDRRPNCVWSTSNDFADRMRNGEYDLPEYLRADYCVAIDDLGAARDKTEFVADGLYRLADQRMHRWMIWTTNLDLAEIGARLDPRISSRLIRDENVFATISAPDYAMRKRRSAA